jgi:endoglucanase
MTRVKTVVDWAIENEMFVILNVHHDDLTQSEMNSMYGYCVDLDSTLQTKSKAYLTSVWSQIAATFASYDEHLVFEVLNEPRYRDGENNGFTSPENLSAYNAVISDYETSCISAIRAVKGNSTRFIMVPYYAAAPYEFAGWTLPEDSTTDKLLVSTHAYSPYGFAMYDGTEHTLFSNDPTVWDDDDEIKLIFSTTMTNAPLAQWLNNGIGVVMGEASASDKDNYSERLKWTQSYFTYAQEAGVPVILWDNQNTFENNGSNGDLSENHGWLNRTNCTWFFPEIVEEMISIARGQ